MAGLSQQEISEFREIFDLVDTDKGGSISKEELMGLMDTLGINATSSEIREISAAVDADKDGSIDFDEFLSTMVMNRTAETAFESVYEQGQRGKGAVLTKAELKGETLLEGLRRNGLGGIVEALALHRSSSTARSKLARTPPPPRTRPSKNQLSGCYKVFWPQFLLA